MTGVSSLAQALSQINRIKDQQSQFDLLSYQLSTGKKTDKFSGLGTDVVPDTRARANISALDTYNTNITNASRRIDLMLNAVNEFQAQAQNLYSQLIGLAQESTHQGGEIIYYDDPLTPTVNEDIPIGQTSGEPDADLHIVQTLAGDVYGILEDLLNMQEGDRYLLGGADTTTKPLNDVGTLETAVSSQIDDWKNGTIPTTDLIANLNDRDPATSGNTDCINDTIVGYSATLTAGNAGSVFVRTDDKSEINYTTLANAQPFRDILVAAAYLKSDNLGPIADVYAEPYNAGDPVLTDANGRPLNGAPGADINESKDNFFAVINSLIKTVHDALDGIQKISFDLESKKARLDEIQQQHTLENNTLQNLVGDIEGVDVNEVAVKVTALQTSLEASYSVTARVLQLSLVNYIS